MGAPKNILLVGCGNLGRAMLSSWLKQDEETRFILLETNPSLELLDLIEPYNARISFNPTSAFKMDAAVFAVKPQALMEALAALGRSIPESAVVISVAAGKHMSSIAVHLHDQQPLVRAMPNVAASVGEAMSVCIANEHVKAEQRDLATALMTSIGQVEWVDDEAWLDGVTAVSGSGPAYFFLLVEEMAKAGVEVGLSEALAANLARQTLIGAAMLLKNPAMSPQALRKQVTSPNGTTQAALDVLMGEQGLSAVVSKAVKAAHARARELAD